MKNIGDLNRETGFGILYTIVAIVFVLACDLGTRGSISLRLFRSHLGLQRAQLECLWIDTEKCRPCLWHSKLVVAPWPHTKKSQACCKSRLGFLIRMLPCVKESLWPLSMVSLSAILFCLIKTDRHPILRIQCS